MNVRPALDWKSILCFVLLAVGLGTAWAHHAATHGLLRNPRNVGIVASDAQLTVLVSALVTMSLFSRGSFRRVGWRFGPFRAYLGVLVGVGLVVAAVTLLALAFGFLSSPSGHPLSPAQVAVTVPILLVFTSVFSFAEEFGWRGFLLPKLLPLGVRAALLVSGLCWFLWEAPLVWFGLLDSTLLPLNAPLTLACHFLQTVAIAVIFGCLRLRYDSVFLPGFAHGCLNALGGLAVLLLAERNPLLGDFGGPIGTVAVLGVAVWFWREAKTLPFLPPSTLADLPAR